MGHGQRLIAGSPSTAQAKRDVLDHAQVREQEIILEDHTHPALLRGDEDSLFGVIEDRLSQCDATILDGQEPG
jgi:hypothetical protein